MGKNQHVVPHGNQWAVKGEGNSRATRVVPTQAEAIAVAKPIAVNRGSGVVIHRPDGTIRDSDSYGNESPKIDKKH